MTPFVQFVAATN